MCDILKSQSLSSTLVTRRFLGYESIRYRTDALITANGNLHFRVLTRVSELNLNSQVTKLDLVFRSGANRDHASAPPLSITMSGERPALEPLTRNSVRYSIATVT
jgi:hypothetical protein